MKLFVKILFIISFNLPLVSCDDNSEESLEDQIADVEKIIEKSNKQHEQDLEKLFENAPYHIGSCKLDKPISLQGYNLYKNRFDLVDVNFFGPPQFKDFSYQNLAIDNIKMQIFNIEVNATLTDLIGARISKGEGGPLTSLGFSNEYIGHEPKIDGVKFYRQKNISIFTDAQGTLLDKNMTKHNVSKELNISIIEGRIFSIEMILPIEKYDRNRDELYFTKKYQTICVKNAKLSGVLNFSTSRYTSFN